jgi:hypothetical protein
MTADTTETATYPTVSTVVCENELLDFLTPSLLPLGIGASVMVAGVQRDFGCFGKSERERKGD